MHPSTSISNRMSFAENIITSNIGEGLSIILTPYSDQAMPLAETEIEVYANQINNNLCMGAGAAGGLYIVRGFANATGDIKIIGNEINDNRSAGDGGGMSLHLSDYYAPPTEKNYIELSDNLICDNTSNSTGGGVCIRSSPKNNVKDNIVIRNNIISGNHAEKLAGGLYVYSSAGQGEPDDVLLINNSIAMNSANGLGKGVFINGCSRLDVYNNVIWGNIDSEDIVLYNELILNANGYNNNYSIINGFWSNSGDNFNFDPLFSDPLNRDFHLDQKSDCIDTGTNDAPAISDHDFDGNERIFDGDGDSMAIIDIGALEFIYK